jgi:hypothetical protein
MNGTQIEQVRNEVMPIPDQAKMIVVRDQGTLSIANQFFLDIKALRKKIDDVFTPIIQAAHKTHQEAIAQRKKVEEPLIIAEQYLNKQVTTYHQEIEKKRREEEEIARQKAIKEEMERRKQEEEDRLAQATALDEAGAHEEAEALVNETIEENSRPIDVYTPPPETPKVELEGATVKTFWHAEVVDVMKLIKAVANGQAPSNCLIPDMTVLNGLARSLKGQMNYPGVRAVSSSSMSATGKKRAA